MIYIYIYMPFSNSRIPGSELQRPMQDYFMNRRRQRCTLLCASFSNRNRTVAPCCVCLCVRIQCKCTERGLRCDFRLELARRRGLQDSCHVTLCHHAVLPSTVLSLGAVARLAQRWDRSFFLAHGHCMRLSFSGTALLQKSAL